MKAVVVLSLCVLNTITTAAPTSNANNTGGLNAGFTYPDIAFREAYDTYIKLQSEDNDIALQTISTSAWNPAVQHTNNDFVAAVVYPYWPIPRLIEGLLTLDQQLWLQTPNLQDQKFYSSDVRYAWIPEHGGPVRFLTGTEENYVEPTTGFVHSSLGILLNREKLPESGFYLCTQFGINNMLSWYPNNDVVDPSCKGVSLPVYSSSVDQI